MAFVRMYDDEGNQTKKVNIATGLTWTYGYDHLNHLISSERQTTDGGTLEQRVEIKYDVYALRLEKKVDADGNSTFDTTQKYAYDGWNTAKSSPIGLENYDVWADLDGSGSLTTRYLRGDADNQLRAGRWHRTILVPHGPPWLHPRHHRQQRRRGENGEL